MSAAKTVSVVTPAYLAETFIEETIRSVHSQNYRPLEHLVVDDGSPDRQVELVEALAADLNDQHYSLRLVRHKDNQGAAQALATGIRAAEGQAICWLSADDTFVDPLKTEEQLGLLSAADIVFDDSCLQGPHLDDCVRVTPRWPQPMGLVAPLRKQDPDAVLLALLFGNPINGTSLMVRREVLDHKVSFDPELGNLDADGDFLMRASALGLTIRPRSASGTFYRIHPGQTSQKIEDMEMGMAVSRIRLLRGLEEEGKLEELVSRNSALLAGGIFGGQYCSPTVVSYLAHYLASFPETWARLLSRTARGFLGVTRRYQVPPKALMPRVREAERSEEFQRFRNLLAQRDA